ncbi:S41 family peptidase [Legionella bononiensis]|uniref:S41 family peptidase n=1 Tax=Legionella bononiensis TaxID=2793102 RepID=A0ABS1W901_9GAMM|nr:S41 family peptidase [Legionella bononiensis]MBL7479651.1 S41 family peptidase [Legionella bononiensis]MBL7525837.1 S41 family peptidase [Legionella bononiensis]MBL7562357.1 S41 family peptidase [Legionella bononiensis]
MVIKKILPSTVALLFALALMLPLTAFTADETDTNNTNTKRIPLEDVQRFSNAIGEIKKYYVKPIDDKELFDNAIRGMLSGLDPHSSYLNEEEFKELQTSTSGEFGGLGIEVTMEDGVVKVITPLVDTPAFKAGIKSGDYIIKLGKESVQGLTLKDAVNLMRGKAGTTIELTVLRKGVSKPLTFDLIREVIQIKSVKSKMLSDGYGYIRLTQFQALTGKDMLQAIEQLKQQSNGKLKGLVLDLRNNPGGLLDSAIQVSDAFLGNDKSGKQELIVYTEGRLPGSKFTALANPGDVLDNAPIVVLINNGSASASEIVAGALKDNKRAIILGTKSFGKGSVQTVLPLDGKTGIKLTTALYYTPSGTSIQAKGIIPDIVVEEMDVPKNSVKKSDATGFSEADLSGHLINKNNPEDTNAKNEAKAEDLIHEDYQLYAALTVLEGMALANR